MAIRSGIAGQLGAATETTFGTFAAPSGTNWFEPTAESLALSIDRIESKGLRQNARVLRTDRWAAGKRGVAGDISMEVLSAGFGFWFRHMLGSASAIADGAGFKNTFVLGDPFGLSFSCQVGRPDTGGTIRAFSYSGCKVVNWDLTNAVDNVLELKVGIDGQQESTSQALGTPSFPNPTSGTNTGTELFYFTEGAITVGGVNTYNIHDWTLSGAVNQKTDRYFINGSGLKSEQIINAYTDLGGTVNAEFTDLTGYNLFTGGTLADIVLTYTGLKLYDTAKPNKIIITAKNCRFDGTTPNLNGQDVVNVALPFKLRYDGTNTPITIEYDTAADEHQL